MTCEMCVNYGFYEMVTSRKPYGYSGTIPCFTCNRYCNLSDKFVSKEKGGDKDMKKVKVILKFNENDLGEQWMNKDNLELLLYTFRETKKDLLKIVSYEEIEKMKAEKAKEIVKYELSEDGVGLLGFFEDGTYYHIHSDELTKIEKQILEWLLQHSIPEAIENRIKKLKEVTKVQCSKGNFDVDEYMRGMANGLILAEAIMEDKDPKYYEPTAKSNGEYGEV